MGIQKVILCDHCNSIIRPLDGVIVQGNIYIVDENIDDRGGLVGNNIQKDGIKESFYHHSCLNSILSAR